MRVTVRKHYRKTRNKVSVVRRHSRIAKKAVTKLRQQYKVKSPIKIEHAKESRGTSLAHTDTVIDTTTKRPVKHTVRLETSKIKSEGEDMDKILHHELAHILDKEKKDFVKSAKGKKLIADIKNTEAYKKLSSKYEKAPEELFARAYSQHKTGKASKKDIATGLAWDKAEFKPISKLLKNI